MNSIYCYKCGFPDNYEQAKFCEYCGNELKNKCTDEKCDSNDIVLKSQYEIRPESRFCYRCGKKTTFNILGAFDK